jgi:hypothetical protein
VCRGIQSAVIVQNASLARTQHPPIEETMALAADEGWTKSQLMGGVEESAIAATKGKGKVCIIYFYVYVVVTLVKLPGSSFAFRL